MTYIDVGDLIDITLPNGETKTYKVLNIEPDPDDPYGPYGYKLIIVETDKL